MMNVIKSSAFIHFDDIPSAVLAHSAAVIVCKVGRYDSGRDVITIVLKRELDRLEPIFRRLL